jgi:hypothetical protein
MARNINNRQRLTHRDPIARLLPRFKPQTTRNRTKYCRKGRHAQRLLEGAKRSKAPLSGARRFGCISTGSYGPAIGILSSEAGTRYAGALLGPTGTRYVGAWEGPARVREALLQTHRRIHSHSWRLLQASLAAQVAAVAPGVRYRSRRGGLGARPPSPPVSALSEVETMFRCGFRSIRAWRRARRYGGFPEPARVSTEGPIWTERQIAAWLGEDHLGMDRLPIYDRLDVVTTPVEEDVVSEANEAEAAILRELEAA